MTVTSFFAASSLVVVILDVGMATTTHSSLVRHFPSWRYGRLAGQWQATMMGCTLQ